MDTVFYKGKKYSGIRMPRSSEIKLYSMERQHKGRYVETVHESDLDNLAEKDKISSQRHEN